MSNKDRPHTAILSVELEVHYLNDKGECSGHTIHKEILKEYGIDSAFLLSISGKNMEECLNNLKTKLEVLKNGIYE